jgi:hypothetical protein
MSESTTVREKRLCVGARVSGSFGDFYPNPDPNIKRRKRMRIFGMVQEACGPRKYRVCFDSGLIVDCFSNTLRLETSSASVPADILAAAVTRDESTEVAPSNEIRNIIEENEAAANDIELEEHLPESPEHDEQEEDDDDLIVNDSTELEEQEASEQRPVGVLLPDIGTRTTYAERKEAAQRRIAALLGDKVTIERGRTESLEWVVVKESIPDTVEKPKESVGLANYGQLMNDAQAGTFLAQLFLHLTFKVSRVTYLFFFKQQL